MNRDEKLIDTWRKDIWFGLPWTLDQRDRFFMGAHTMLVILMQQGASIPDEVGRKLSAEINEHLRKMNARIEALNRADGIQ